MRYVSRSSQGYTLIEVLIAVAIVALLTALATTDFLGFVTNYSFATDKSTVRDALFQARSLASTQKLCARVRIASNVLSVTTHTPQGPPTLCDDPLTAVVGGPLAFPMRAGTTISPTFSNGTTDLVFLPLGGIRDTVSVTLQITSTTSHSQTFTVYPAIGQISVQ